MKNWGKEGERSEVLENSELLFVSPCPTLPPVLNSFMPDLVFLNGSIVPEAEARVSIFDRGFLYGDGIFETVRVANGRLFNWGAHVHRFEHGLALLRVRCPFSPDSLQASAMELIQRSQMSRGLMRLCVSRGVGVRGYSTRGADQPTVAIMVYPSDAPPRSEPLRWSAHVSRQRLLSGQDVSRSKTASKLVQILARMEAEDAGADEALLLNERGEVIEASGCNFFWISGGRVYAPTLDAGALPGVAGQTVETVCERLRIPFLRSCLPLAELLKVDGAFLTTSSQGVVELIAVDRSDLARSPLVLQIWQGFEAWVDTETRASTR